MALIKCSYCGKVCQSDHTDEPLMWVDEPEALKDYPLYSHGMCPPCFEREMKEIEKGITTC